MHVFQKMLAKDRFAKKELLGATISFTGGKQKRLSQLQEAERLVRLGNVLFNTILQAVGHVNNTLTITMAHNAIKGR